MILRTLARWLLAVAVVCAAPLPASAADSQGTLQLERIVLLMRHGIRPPTKDNVTPPGIAADPWPSWNTPFGYLTDHGAKALQLLGAYDRTALAARGLIPNTGCPNAAELVAWADTDERTIKSAQAWLDGFVPGCHVAPGHKPQGAVDPLFSPLDGVTPFDAAAAKSAILEDLGAQGLDGVVAVNRPALDKFQDVAKCCSVQACADAGLAAGCAFADLHSAIKTKVPNERPDLVGPLQIGSSATETIMLEYVEGKPMKDVGWGRASPDDIELMLTLHPSGKFRVLNRPAYVADRAAALFTKRMLDALQTGTAKVTLLLGHDTNVADLGGLLNVHWKVPSFPADDVAPGAAMGFELLKDAAGKRYVRIVYQSQTMGQMRNLTPLTLKSPPSYFAISLPGCEAEQVEKACPIDTFLRTVETKMVMPASIKD